MMAVTEWILKKIIRKKLQRAVWNRFGCKMELDISTFELTCDRSKNTVTLKFGGEASMDMDEFAAIAEKLA